MTQTATQRRVLLDTDDPDRVAVITEVRTLTWTDVERRARQLASALASFEVPKSFDVVDALPREAHCNLKKHLLRQPYWEDSR